LALWKPPTDPGNRPRQGRRRPEAGPRFSPRRGRKIRAGEADSASRGHVRWPRTWSMTFLRSSRSRRRELEVIETYPRRAIGRRVGDGPNSRGKRALGEHPPRCENDGRHCRVFHMKRSRSKRRIPPAEGNRSRPPRGALPAGLDGPPGLSTTFRSPDQRPPIGGLVQDPGLYRGGGVHRGRCVRR